MQDRPIDADFEDFKEILKKLRNLSGAAWGVGRDPAWIRDPKKSPLFPLPRPKRSRFRSPSVPFNFSLSPNA